MSDNNNGIDGDETTDPGSPDMFGGDQTTVVVRIECSRCMACEIKEILVIKDII